MIYKPTSCEPLLLTFDATQTPFFLECQIDSANTKVDAYSIKLLNSENNEVVFGHEDDEFEETVTLISDLKTYFNTNYASYGVGYINLNTGLNGSFLKIPFIVADGMQDASSVKYNQLYYQVDAQGDHFYYIDDNNPIPIYNGIGYKWQITLYQLTNNTKPASPKYYDMLVANGVVMGSNQKRIQSIKSDKILADYYIQPIKVDNLSYNPGNPMGWTGDPSENRGPRVLIKSYDPTYGYIYPAEGSDGFAKDIIELAKGANAFRIYKRGNSPENLTAYQKVAYVVNKNIKLRWETTLTNISESYGEYKYNTIEKQTTYNFTDLFDIDGIGTVNSGARLVLNGQGIIYDGSKSIYVATDASTGAKPYESNGKWFDTGLFALNDANKWSSENIYNRYDIIKKASGQNDVYYISKENANINHEPGAQSDTWWQLISSQSVGAWVSSTAYNVFDLCLDKSHYILPQTTAQDTWSGEVEYKINDIVRHEDKNYISLQNGNINHTPGDQTDTGYWQLIVSGSPYNGIFYPTFSSNAIRDVSNNIIGYENIIRFMRTPDADTWGELTNKLVYVESTGSPFYGDNIQPDAAVDVSSGNYYGVINETPVTFIPEKPIAIYTDGEDDNHNEIGIIFYNKIQSSNPLTNGIVYIRPFIGIQKDQVLILNSATNLQNFIYLQTVNTDYWFVEYNTLYQYNINTQQSVSIDDDDGYWTPDESRYTIKTFYRDSDENPFYFNTAPVVKITLDDGTEIPSNATEYNPNTTYNIDNIVFYQNQYFVCRNIEAGAVGVPKIASQLPVYEATKEYDTNSIVYYEGIIYKGKAAEIPINTPPSNGDYWWIYQWQTYEPNVASRTLVCSAEYSQNECIQWKSAQWFLYDSNHNVVDKSDVIYDGEIKFVFTGLGGKNFLRYTIELIVETYQGFRLTIPQQIQTGFQIEEIESQDLITTSFDCDRLGVISTLKFASAFIKPDEGAEADYTYNAETGMGTMQLGGAIVYDTITQDPSDSSSSSAKIKSNSGELEIKTSTKICTQDFTGDILNIESFADDADHSGQPVGRIRLYIPDQLVVIDALDPANALSEYGINKLEAILNSSDRFQIKLLNKPIRLYDGVSLDESQRIGEKLYELFVKTKVYQRGAMVGYGGKYYEMVGDSQTPIAGTDPQEYKSPSEDIDVWEEVSDITALSDNNWNRGDHSIAGTYITVSVWQPVALANDPNATTNYLPVTYAYVVDRQCRHYIDKDAFPVPGEDRYVYIDDNDGQLYQWDANNERYTEDSTYKSFLNIDDVFNVYSATPRENTVLNYTIKHIQQGDVTKDNFSTTDTTNEPDIFEAMPFCISASSDQDNAVETTALYLYGPTPHMFNDLKYYVKNIVYSGDDGTNHTTQLIESNVLSVYNGVFEDREEEDAFLFDGMPYQNTAQNTNIIGQICINNVVIQQAYADGDDELTKNNSTLLMRQKRVGVSNTNIEPQVEYWNPERNALNGKVLSIDIPIKASNNELSVEYGTGIEPVIFITANFINDDV